MKRCKAVTSRASGEIACALLFEHEGAHEGELVEDGYRFRAVWNNPNAPHLEIVEPVVPKAPPLPVEFAPEPKTKPDVAIVRSRTIATHCACGTEHTGDDRELRVGASGMPLIAMLFGEPEPDPRMSWPRVCIGCGAVYCRIWEGKPIAPEPRSCTCPLTSRQRRDFMHDADCPAAQIQSP